MDRKGLAGLGEKDWIVLERRVGFFRKKGLGGLGEKVVMV